MTDRPEAAPGAAEENAPLPFVCVEDRGGCGHRWSVPLTLPMPATDAARVLRGWSVCPHCGRRFATAIGNREALPL